jgi:hypothetical protein
MSGRGHIAGEVNRKACSVGVEMYWILPDCAKKGATPCNEGTRVWRDRCLERKFTSVHPETGIKSNTLK